MQNSAGISDYINIDIMENVMIVPPKFNRMWGIDYMLMDSNSFKDGVDYFKMIDMYQNIWNVYNYRLFSDF